MIRLDEEGARRVAERLAEGLRMAVNSTVGKRISSGIPPGHPTMDAIVEKYIQVLREESLPEEGAKR